MKRKITQIIFFSLFSGILLIPLITTNLKDDVISETENRYLASKPLLIKEGAINRDFFSDFEIWINDNIGFRKTMVAVNAKIQYYAFDVLSNNSDMYLGPNGELNYATNDMLLDYQHNNYYSQDYMDDYASSMQAISDYVKDHGSKFYYYQCWDKHSIYPEQFPSSVIQHGNVSRTDLLIETLKEKTNVYVVSPKKELIEAKDKYTTYSTWGDPSHWSYRGSIIGYNVLLSEINKREKTNYHLLNEEDYDVSVTDQGTTIFGGIHKEDYQEEFKFKIEESTNRNDLLTFLADDPRSAYYINPLAKNDETVLLIADSYFSVYCFWDFTYSFRNVVFIHADHIEELPKIIDAYPSDYVIFECAERVDRTQAVINAAQKILDPNRIKLSIYASDLFADEDIISDDEIILHPGHTQYGPYVPLEMGDYKIIVYGNGFGDLDSNCIYINPNSWYSVEAENINISDNKIEYTVHFIDNLYELELGIKNLTEREIEIYKIEVFYSN